MHPPVVLDEAGQVDVVGVRNHQIAIRQATAQRDREQQVVVVHPAVAVAIERGKVLDQLDAAVAEHAEVELRVHALQLAADLPLMPPAHERQRVGELPTLLGRALRHPEGGPRLDAGKGQLDTRGDRSDGVVEIAVAHAQRIDGPRRQHARPGAEHRMEAITRLLALRCRADGAIERRSPRCRPHAGPNNARMTSSAALARQSTRTVPSRSSSGAGANARRMVRATVSRTPTSVPPS